MRAKTKISFAQEVADLFLKGKRFSISMQIKKPENKDKIK